MQVKVGEVKDKAISTSNQVKVEVKAELSLDAVQSLDYM